jgi:hypothetical protein
MATDAPKLTPQLFVVQGLYTTASGKRAIALRGLALATGRALGEERCFPLRRKDRAFNVGSVYAIPASVDQRQVQLSGAQYKCEFADAQQAAAWQADQVSRDLADRARKLEKDGKYASLQSAVDRLRQAYRNTRAQDRTAFQVWLLKQLEK